MRILRSCIVLVKKDEQILLGLNRRGFHRGRWTGFGGVVQPKEDIKNCALRNTRDQCGLIIEKLEKLGKIEIKIAGVPEVVQVHIFIADAFSGEARDSREMQLEWFSVNDLPFKNMWPDSYYWLPRILKGEKVKGFFVYQNETLIHQDLNTDSYKRFQRQNYNGILKAVDC